MTLIDISRALTAETAVWPGDSRFHLESILSRKQGESVNLTTLHLSAHMGAHIDAPLHFTDSGRAVAELELEPFWGPAQVVTLREEKISGPLTPADFAHAEIGRAPRLLVHSAVSQSDPTQFPKEFVYPSPELADFLGEKGIVLYGSDAPSMDHADSKSLPGHNALLRNQISILEWLDLSQAADGLYELCALPLKVVGGDGSPVRAVLRQ